MIKKYRIVIIVCFLISIMMFAGCKKEKPMEPTEPPKPETNLFWDSSVSELRRFSLGDSLYNLSWDFINTLTQNGYHSISDMSDLITIGYGKNDVPYLYGKINDQDVNVVYALENNGFLICELHFKNIKGDHFNNYYEGTFENSRFSWMGLTMNKTQDEVIKRLGEPTNIEYDENGDVKIVDYTLKQGETTQFSIKIEFIGKQFWSVRMISKLPET